uniref:Uncharacterized protein n=1 Tax=Anopheles quadriannulatus TaxID=34691 RepID=A0A182XFV6_ANOQN
MSPQQPVAFVAAVVAPATSSQQHRINSSSRSRHPQQVASTKLFKKKLCVHPTTMFRIVPMISNGLIRSPKMVKYSAAPCRSCPTVCHQPLLY